MDGISHRLVIYHGHVGDTSLGPYRCTELCFACRSAVFFTCFCFDRRVHALACRISIGFASIPEKDNAAFLLAMLACLAWNAVVFAVLAPRMFPNFW